MLFGSIHIIMGSIEYLMTNVYVHYDGNIQPVKCDRNIDTHATVFIIIVDCVNGIIFSLVFVFLQVCILQKVGLFLYRMYIFSKCI